MSSEAADSSRVCNKTNQLLNVIISFCFIPLSSRDHHISVLPPEKKKKKKSPVPNRHVLQSHMKLLIPGVGVRDITFHPSVVIRIVVEGRGLINLSWYFL